jgi:hypothetical protein
MGYFIVVVQKAVFRDNNPIFRGYHSADPIREQVPATLRILLSSMKIDKRAHSPRAAVRIPRHIIRQILDRLIDANRIFIRLSLRTQSDTQYPDNDKFAFHDQPFRVN